MLPEHATHPDEEWFAIAITAGPLTIADPAALIRDFEREFGRWDGFRSINISWDSKTRCLIVAIETRKVEMNMLDFAEFVVVEALDELPEPPSGYRVLAIPTWLFRRRSRSC